MFLLEPRLGIRILSKTVLGAYRVIFNLKIWNIDRWRFFAEFSWGFFVSDI